MGDPVTRCWSPVSARFLDAIGVWQCFTLPDNVAAAAYNHGKDGFGNNWRHVKCHAKCFDEFDAECNADCAVSCVGNSSLSSFLSALILLFDGVYSVLKKFEPNGKGDADLKIELGTLLVGMPTEVNNLNISDFIYKIMSNIM